MISRQINSAVVSRLLGSKRLCALVVFLSLSSTEIVFAHSPFDCSARIIVMDEQLEASVTAGTSLAAELLKDSGQMIPTTSGGIGKILPLELAARFFELDAGSEILSPTEVRVLSDGLEMMFVVKFPKPITESFRVRAKFAASLLESGFASLVVTDDNNRVLADHVVKVGSEAAEFKLPDTSGGVAETVAPVARVIPIPSETSAAQVTIIRPRLTGRILMAIPFAVVFGWIGWSLVQKTFRRKTNEV